MEETGKTGGSSMSPKASFALGVLGAVALFSLIGLGIMLKLYFKNTPGSGGTVVSNSGQQAQDNTASQPNAEVPAVTGDDHIRGNKDAKVTLVEYSDFECPFCKQFHPIVQSVLKEYGDKIRWVYRQFPLESIHPNARKEAEASECAAEQGKFWEFADKIFERTTSNGYGFALTDLPKLAGELGLNVTQFNQCFSTGKYASKVEGQLQGGIKAGVKGTPGGFVNGIEVPGAVPAEELKRIIDQALSKV